MKKHYVYVLLSLKDDKKYIGFTENLERRVNEHIAGLVKSTKRRQPLRLVYKEQFDKKSKALKREKFLKSGKGREFLDQKLRLVSNPP